MSLRPTLERNIINGAPSHSLPAAELTVLVADDDSSINLLLQTRLRLRGLNVLSAQNGREALDILDAGPVDMILLDVSMPILGGMEVLTEVRARKLDTAIVMTTAFGSEQIAIEALRRGADDYLRKPFESAELKAVLDRTIDRLQLHRQNEILRQRLDEQRRALEAELARAGEVQRALLPVESPPLAGYGLAGRCLPSRNVGGDFYDWQLTGHDLTVVLGDVMGKGMPAALVMATARAALRTVAASHEPGESIYLVDRALFDDLNRSDEFITLLLMHADLQAHRIRFVDAGHGHAFVLRRAGGIELLEPRGVPLGVFADSAWSVGVIQLEPGDAIIAYSDGLIDSDPDNPLDPPRIAEFLEGARTAQDLIDRMTLLVPEIDALPDDLTLLALRRNDRED
jgi:serine phosphatase RsbU (regulator of sigma subunit)